MIRVWRGLKPAVRPPTRAVATVGVFDGVHIAHQQLIRSVIRLARRLNGTSVVVTFDPDPQIILDPTHPQPTLMPLQERLECLEALGVDRALVIPFTKRFARMRAEDFIHRILISRLRAVALVVGETFVFGRNRRGGMAVLRALGPPRGMQIVPLRLVRCDGARVSSSRIRRLIERGHLNQAKHLLGRPPALYGEVVRGSGRGRRLGIPTANIRLIPQVLPPQGVYVVLVKTDHPRRAWRGVMNLGRRPTFGPGPLVCEVHLLEFSGTLLGRWACVSLLARLRSERCFSSPQALIRQVRQDVVRARRIFARFA